jgi:hypothetical protein
MPTENDLGAIKAKHSKRLLSMPGVSGVGIERTEIGEPILTVYLEHAGARDTLPDRLEGFPIRYIVTGPFQKRE